MDQQERRELRQLSDEVSAWHRQAALILELRQRASDRASVAEKALRSRAVRVNRDEHPVAVVIPLTGADKNLVVAFADAANLPQLSGADSELLHIFGITAAATIAEVQAVTGLKRFFLSSARHAESEGSVSRLHRLHARGVDQSAGQRLASLAQPVARVDPSRLDVGDVLGDALGIGWRLAPNGPPPVLLRAGEVNGLATDLRMVTEALHQEQTLRSEAVEAGTAVRNVEANRLLAGMPVDRLREASRDRVRTTPLVEAGISTVLAVLRNEQRLSLLPGVGETSAVRLRAAAWSIAQATFDEMPVRIDLQARHPKTTALLNSLANWDAARRARGSDVDLSRVRELRSLAAVVGSQTRFALVLPMVPDGSALLRESLSLSGRLAAILRGLQRQTQQRADPWEEFLARPADFFTMLAELGLVVEDAKKAEGDLPDDIVRAIRAQELRTDHLKASLRGYQAFAARFALVQRKVIIGDEMGLGKTVEALAVFSHLASTGQHFFLVICPAAVVTNWIREVTSKTDLRAHRLHGSDRRSAARDWARGGGVAVTTYETLGWLDQNLPNSIDIECVVLDEAHLIKNPAAKRSILSANRINRSPRAMLLTGTPLENRVEEFRNLANYVRPDLVLDATDFAPKRFRRQIAPAYLRRNQEDVLSELPELVAVEEWLPLSAHDRAAYERAVGEGNFMAMRQAAMLGGHNSQKVQRLVELVTEAEENGRRIIVYSYFRAVLEQLRTLLPGPIFGPLTGSVPANTRQSMVDEFSKARHGAVLLSQIVAGGVGLNIQAASVVVICEPQLKPTTEAQAIARAHRMGQVQSVQVHRLLSEEGADVRITEILATKQRLFDEFARVSETAASTPEAMDVTESQLAQQVIAAERQRLFAARQAGPSTATTQPVSP